VTGIDSDLRALQVLCDSEALSVDLRPLRQWWTIKLVASDSLESACRGRPAESMLREGIGQCALLRRDRFVGTLVLSYLRYASALPARPDLEPDFLPPVWLSWVRDAAGALDQWKRSLAALGPLASVLIERTWKTGLQQIAAGYPSASRRLWSEVATLVLQEKLEADARLLDVQSRWRASVALAEELRVPPPSLPGEGATAEVMENVLAEWRRSTLENEMVRRFWRGHRPFLESTRQRSAPPLTPERRQALNQLVLSALKSAPPGEAEMQALCDAYNQVSDEMLSALERKCERDH
jgi:hypothetical protein